MVDEIGSLKLLVGELRSEVSALRGLLASSPASLCPPVSIISPPSVLSHLPVSSPFIHREEDELMQLLDCIQGLASSPPVPAPPPPSLTVSEAPQTSGPPPPFFTLQPLLPEEAVMEALSDFPPSLTVSVAPQFSGPPPPSLTVSLQPLLPDEAVVEALGDTANAIVGDLSSSALVGDFRDVSFTPSSPPTRPTTRPTRKRRPPDRYSSPPPALIFKKKPRAKARVKSSRDAHGRKYWLDGGLYTDKYRDLEKYVSVGYGHF